MKSPGGYRPPPGHHNPKKVTAFKLDNIFELHKSHTLMRRKKFACTICDFGDFWVISLIGHVHGISHEQPTNVLAFTAMWNVLCCQTKFQASVANTITTKILFADADNSIQLQTVVWQCGMRGGELKNICTHIKVPMNNQALQKEVGPLTSIPQTQFD